MLSKLNRFTLANSACNYSTFTTTYTRENLYSLRKFNICNLQIKSNKDEQNSYINHNKPILRASDLAKICINDIKETTVLSILKQFEPFSSIFKSFQAQLIDHFESRKFILTDQEKFQINKALNQRFSSGNLRFDDRILCDSVLFNNSFNRYVDDSNQELEKFFPENYISKSSYFAKENLRKLKLKRKQAQIYISTRRGLELENKIINITNKEKGTQFVKNNQIKQIDFGNFILKGRADGIDSGRHTLIEIKTRNKPAYYLSFREKIQIIVYMKLYNCNRCVMVEHLYNDKRFYREFLWNQSEFDYIIRRIERFCDWTGGITVDHFRHLVEKYYLR